MTGMLDILKVQGVCFQFVFLYFQLYIVYFISELIECIIIFNQFTNKNLEIIFIFFALAFLNFQVMLQNVIILNYQLFLFHILLLKDIRNGQDLFLFNFKNSPESSCHFYLKVKKRLKSQI